MSYTFVVHPFYFLTSYLIFCFMVVYCTKKYQIDRHVRILYMLDIHKRYKSSVYLFSFIKSLNKCLRDFTFLGWIEFFVFYYKKSQNSVAKIYTQIFSSLNFQNFQKGVETSNCN